MIADVIVMAVLVLCAWDETLPRYLAWREKRRRS